MHRPLPRTVLAAFTLSSVLALTGTAPASAGSSAPSAGASTSTASGPSMTPIRTDVRKLSASSDGPSFPSATGGQSSLRVPKATTRLGRKLK